MTVINEQGPVKNPGSVQDGQVVKQGVVNTGTVASPVQTQPKQEASTVDDMKQLLELILKREARVALKEQELEDALSRRQEQYKRNASSDDSSLKNKQASCRHLKGGRNRKAASKIDYAVYMFTFINRETWVKCQLCGMKWCANDTPDYLVRGDKAIKNHTGLGWRDALRMVGESSNTPASSEIPFDVTAGQPMPPALDTGRAVPNLPIDTSR